MAEDKIVNWDIIEPKLKKEFPELHGEELNYEEGKEEDLLKKLQDKLKQDRKNIRSWLRIMG